ncbi:MAG: sulfatase [Planctomycetota bacterium]
MQRLCMLVWLFLGSSFGHAQEALPGAVGIQDPRSSRPNVLFIISDDLNNRLGCYGHATASTPHLDALAARGVRFDRAYCTFPLCGPSRNSILTGLYPNSTGILNNGQIFRQTIPRQASVPQAMRLAGYFAGRIGKLYHYNVPNSVGTNGHDDPASWEMELNPAGVERLVEQPQIKTLVPEQFGGTLSWYASPHPESNHTDSLQAKDAEWVLERMAREKDRPFMLCVGFFRPHTPYVAPREYFDLHDPAKVQLVRGVEEDRQDIPKPALASGKKEQDDMSEETAREAIQAYDASISFMDAQLGKILSALDRLGLAQNTMIVFTSDHGYHVGEHGLWQKMSLFEESARVPLLIVAPGVSQPGSVVREPVSHVDLAPTLYEWCGLPRSAAHQGESLIPYLRDPSHAGRGWALTQVTRGGNDNRFFGYSLRTQQWRYTEWEDGKRGVELYDHATDPLEITNLVNRPEHAATIAQLSEQLQAAIRSSLPVSGITPDVKPLNWAPDLTNVD